jgi:hypothetical protein
MTPNRKTIAIAFGVMTCVLCLAILVAWFWVVSCFPMLVLWAAAPLLPATVASWLESPIARLVCACAGCAALLWYDAFVWPRRAAGLLRKWGL